MSQGTKEIVYTLSDNEPNITPCPPSGSAWTEGDRIHFFKRHGDADWYYCFTGVAKGLAYESEDQGPYGSLYEAAEQALYYLEETNPREALRLLTHLIADGHHDIDLRDFQRRLNLPDDWTWEDLDDALIPADIHQGRQRVRQIHDAIHKGLR